MAVSTNGPVASKHIFIHNLLDQEVGAKVRFLGCVTDYEDGKGQLIVEHNYASGLDSAPSTKAIVDVNMLLESMKIDAVQPGSWINIIGYVRNKSPRKARRSLSGHRMVGEDLPKIQAILIWNAGAVQVRNYEKTLEEQMSLRSEQ